MPAVISGTGFVTEHTAADGTRTVLPLIAWQIVDGEVYPLPRSLSADTIVRPAIEGDDRLIRATAARMRPQKTNKNDWNQWRTNLWP